MAKNSKTIEITNSTDGQKEPDTRTRKNKLNSWLGISRIENETIQLAAKNSKTQERTNPSDREKISRHKKEPIKLITKKI